MRRQVRPETARTEGTAVRLQWVFEFALNRYHEARVRGRSWLQLHLLSSGQDLATCDQHCRRNRADPGDWSQEPCLDSKGVHMGDDTFDPPFEFIGLATENFLQIIIQSRDISRDSLPNLAR
jgi:hypothetical protein